MEPKMLNVAYSDISISEFRESFLLEKYDFEPTYQREYIWALEKKQYLMDSILKKFPLPPIFLKLKLDPDTGKSLYDVVDGKQRLNSIIEFIEDKFALPDNYSDGPFGDERLNGLKFSELVGELKDYKSEFWKYKLSVAYIDTDNRDVISGIFDRLNRNGEPLTFQELRNAKYQDSKFLMLIKEFAEHKFLKERLAILEVERKGDHEFISELLLMQLEKQILDSSNTDIDMLYTKYIPLFESNNALEKETRTLFYEVLNYMINLKIDYEDYKVSGVSHLYAFWAFSYYCCQQHIEVNKVADALHRFLEYYLNKDYDQSNALEEYKKSMSSGTRQKGKRIARVNALIRFCNDQNPELHIDLI
ncbi:DUF262 domain-containing protein [Butyricimonas virosa]|uniref:DUF262 domain-containing protein n=1 Tax=Butyricimonas virosa TaxID=544645 RepID=UPI003AAB2982